VRDGLGRIGSVLVLGGASDIALATVRALVADGTERVVLASREPVRLEAEADALRHLGASAVELVAFDACELGSHEVFVERAFAAGDLDLVLVAFGVLGPGGQEQRDRDAALDVLRVNLLGAVSVILPVVARLEQQGHGSLAVLSSVAGERARASNFVYGASKAGLDAFSQGLGDLLAGSGVHVMVVRPGHVRTKMTAGRPAQPLTITPEAVAAATVDGLRARAHTIWVPWLMRWVMRALRVLPRPVFRRLPI
jgi:decaprenylphospho-beta-D-erythro-pentofuranosid-2-ulose 2-reductase